MADGLSALSSENLTAAVNSLLQKPLPECHIIRSKLPTTKTLTTTGLGVIAQEQKSHQIPQEPHSVNLQPLISSTQSSLSNSHQQYQINRYTNLPTLERKPVQYVNQQQFARSSQSKLKNGSVSPKLIKFPVDNIHSGVIPTPESVKSGEDGVHTLGSFSAVQDSNCTLNKVIRPQVSHVHLQNVQKNQPLLTTAPVHLGVNAVNGLGLIQNMASQSAGISLLQQLINAQNQGTLANSATVMPVLSGQGQVQVPRSELPLETSFSQISPTQPLQNLIQNLFSSSGSSQPTETTDEAYTATSVSHRNMETSAEPQKHSTTSISSPTKDQENTYTTHIKLLLEAINKNKTLSPQQFYQIQRSALGQIENDNILPCTSVLNQNQLPVSQGEGHIDMGQGHQSVTQITEKQLPALQSCPMIVQGTTPEGHLQLIPLTNLNIGNLQHISKVTSGVPASVTDGKVPVHIQPKPSGVNAPSLLYQTPVSATSSTDLNTAYSLMSVQQPNKNSAVAATQNGYQTSVDTTSLNISSDGTSHFPNGMQVTSQEEVDERYTASAMEMAHISHTLEGYSTEMQGSTESQENIENFDTDNSAQVADENLIPEESYYEEEVEQNYVFCIDCRKLYKDCCEYHNNVEYRSIPDTPILSRARASLPSIFYLEQSSTSEHKDYVGVWCKECINERTRFGPVIGVREHVKIDQYKLQVRGFNPYQVSVKDDTTVVLELENEEDCNWTLFVRMAHSLLEQNCVVYKQVDQFYIITISEIKEHEELLLWFSRDLCQQLGISEDPGVAKLQQCEHCGKYFTTKKLLNNHLKAAHPQHYKYTCTFEGCGKKFNNQSRLNNHMLTHMNMKPYQCQRCGKCFSDSSNVKAHMNIHTGVKKFQCEICGKTFRQKAHRDAHITTHTGDKKYKCSYCDKLFARQSDLRTHTYRHTNEHTFTCTFCSKVFYKTQALKKHLKIHTGEKNFMCGKCFKEFRTKYHRDRHLKICKERGGKEASYMSLEEVAKFDSTSDGVPLSSLPPDTTLQQPTFKTS